MRAVPRRGQNKVEIPRLRYFVRRYASGGMTDLCGWTRRDRTRSDFVVRDSSPRKGVQNDAETEGGSV